MLTGDFTSNFNPAVCAINPSGFASTWCGRAFVLSLKGDLTYSGDIK